MGFRWRLLAILGTIVTLTSCSSGPMTLRKGERILFFGDSITELGVGPNGYVTLIRKEFTQRYPDLDIEIVGAGISGNKVSNLQDRVATDVIEKKPEVVVIYVGINDVWHWTMPNHVGSTREEYERGLREIIARIQYAGAEVILCTPSVIGERHHGMNAQDTTLDAYSEISRKVVHSLGSRLCDLRTAFVTYLSAHNDANVEKGILTTDRVHLNEEGNKFVAKELLQFFIRP
jgi:lysophospholipase L1-like esterase